MIPTVLPMLAVPGEPFDSCEHVFEVKWDGVRALACVEAGQWRIWGREAADYTDRYPEMDVLRQLPSGTVVDGELTVLRKGRADLNAILGRHQLVSPRKIRYASHQLPVTYILFDLLSHQGRPLLDQPCSTRRVRLQELLEQSPCSGVVFSVASKCPAKPPRTTPWGPVAGNLELRRRRFEDSPVPFWSPFSDRAVTIMDRIWPVTGPSPVSNEPLQPLETGLV